MVRIVSCGFLAIALWAQITLGRGAQSGFARLDQQQDRQAQPSQPNQPNQQGQQAPPTLRRPGDENQPAVGEPGPSRGPNASHIADPRRLRRVRRVFIEDMDNRLNESLADSMTNHEPFAVVTDRRQADALLHGSCLDSARKKLVDSEVYLTGPNGEPIWSDIVRRPYHPPPLAQAVAETAVAIAEDLRESVEQAPN